MDVLAARVSAFTEGILKGTANNRLQSTQTRPNESGHVLLRGVLLLPVTPIRFDSGIISSSSSACDISVYIDADLSMRTHVALRQFALAVAIKQFTACNYGTSTSVSTWIDDHQGRPDAVNLWT